MAMYAQRIGNFASVERLYNDRTPINVRDNNGEPWNTDVRPTNCRGRSWERVVKLSANKYALVNTGSWFYKHTTPNLTKPRYHHEVETQAPILWHRTRQGKEFITVRNGNGLYSSHNSMYNFLERHLPSGIAFIIKQGKQFLCTDSESYYLPKRSFSTARMKEYYAIRGYGSDRSEHKDNKSLVFEVTTNARGFNEYTQVGKIHRHTKKAIDRKAKAKYAKHIQTFKEYTVPLANMLLASGNRNVDSTVEREFTAWYREQTGVHTHSLFAMHRELHTDHKAPTKAHRRAISTAMLDTQGDTGYNLMQLFVYHCSRHEGIRCGSEAVYNKWVNNTLALHIQVPTGE